MNRAWNNKRYGVGGRLYEKDKYFREFAVWPSYSEFNSEAWLENFKHEERGVAERLLTNFTYFNERMTNALIESAVRSYFSQSAHRSPGDRNNMSKLIKATAFVICQGEEPSPADSGNLFARKVRDHLGVSEDNILLPKKALERQSEFDRFLFIDDFCGSGNQFIDTWDRTYSINSIRMSFSTLDDATKKFAFCCCISTQKAKQRINRDASTVHLCPAHQLSKRHCAVDRSASVWKGMDAEAAIRIVKNASARAGYDREDDSQEDWRGFHALGLTLAFNHGIPDASLPIFFSTKNNWRPLVAR